MRQVKQVESRCPVGKCHQETLRKAGIPTGHTELLRGGGEMETVLKVARLCFWSWKVEAIFKIDAEAKWSKNSLHLLTQVSSIEMLRGD